MSRFSIEQLTDSGGAKYYRVFRNSILITTLEQSELADLATAAQAALAEQNSGVAEIDQIALVRTCQACPEQYDAFIGELKVGYLRLRHGYFYASYPDASGKVVYETAQCQGDGIFSDDERDHFLTLAKQALIYEHLQACHQPQAQRREA